MTDSTRSLSSNTVAFACLEPQVALLIVDVVNALASVLRWRPVSKLLLIEILSRLAESSSFEMRHAEFSAALWSYLKDSARERKFFKWLVKMKDDMELSNCPAVRIPQSRKERHADGNFKTLPTLYLPGIFWDLFRAVQDAAMECDLMRESDVKKRRAKVRAIVAKWLNEHEAVPVERQKKEEDVKPAKPSLPCRCACPSCASCAAKAPAVEEDRQAEKRITRHDVSERMGAAFEELFQCGIDWANLDLDLNEYWRRLIADQEMIQERMATAIKRHNAPRKVKMNGGQPK